MLTVITPATSTRLTTVSTIREELGITEEMASDDRVNRWIDQASQAIVDYCGRDFAQQTYLETRDYGGCGSILLSRFPVSSIVEAKLSGAIMAPTDYRLDDADLYRLSSSGRAVAWGPGTVSVQFVAGYILPGQSGTGPKLPATVELACISEVKGGRARAEREDPFVRSEMEEGVGSTSWQVASGGGADSPLNHPETAGLLSAYKLAFIA